MQYPEMVKSNARYRGPRESEKQNASVKDIQSSIARLIAYQAELRAQRKSIFTSINESFSYERPQRMKALSDSLASAKGGEI